MCLIHLQANHLQAGIPAMDLPGRDPVLKEDQWDLQKLLV